MSVERSEISRLQEGRQYAPRGDQPRTGFGSAGLARTLPQRAVAHCPACRVDPPLFSTGRHPVVARMEWSPIVHLDVHVRRSCSGGVVHRLAGLGSVALLQPVLFQSGQRALRGQSVVQHVGDAGWSGPEPGDVAVGTSGGHQRRPDPGARSERMGALARTARPPGLEAGCHPGRLHFRLLGGHCGIADIRTCVSGAACPASTHSRCAL